MTWPAAQVKTNVDAATDDPKLARSDFAANVDKFNQLQAHVTSFMQGLLDDADAATGRATLGAAALAANTFTGAQTLNSALYLGGVISPTQITADTNNYNPTGLADAVALRLSTDASRNLTGLQGTGTGRIINIINVGSNDLVLVNQSASSTAGNRFLFAGGDLTLGADESVLLRYDNTTARWRRADEAGSGGAWTYGTPTATTSGTSHDYTGLPAGLNEVEVLLRRVSTNGTSPLLIQIGDSGGVETTGYEARAGDSADTTSSTAGFPLVGILAIANTCSGIAHLAHFDGANHEWEFVANINKNAGEQQTGAGDRSALNSALDRVRLTTVNGTDTFDAGEFNIRYR